MNRTRRGPHASPRVWWTLGVLLLLLPACRTAGPAGATRYPAVGAVTRLDPRMDALVAPNARLERLEEGFEWTEGPVWVPSGGYLLFSDIPKNTIYRWKEGEGLGVFLRPAGYGGADPAGKELGTNGLMLDAAGRLVMADHGLRAITRLNEDNYTKSVLAGAYQGRRLNSPNDLVFHSGGDIYFTDPPYGLQGLNDSPAKELRHNGVYRLTPAGTVTLLTDALTFPNGIAFSPDEKTLYVAVSDRKNPYIMAYDVQADGTLARERIFFDAGPLANAGKRGMPDGMVVDRNGNLFATGPGGVLVIAPDGTHLGTIETGQATANVTFGGPNDDVLYITADMYLMRIPTRTQALRTLAR